MFEQLNPTKMDPILGLMAAYRADARVEKIDLGVGVYMNDQPALAGSLPPRQKDSGQLLEPRCQVCWPD